jgi:GGDEF domain-containing protein
MDSVATPDDLHRSLRLLRRQPPFAIVLVQVDPGPPPDAGGTAEIEGLIERQLGNTCWRLQDGRYVGVYAGNDIRSKVEALRREIGEQRRWTASVGLALPRGDLGALDLLLRAEQALLAARKAGGNRVALAVKHDASRSLRGRMKNRE